MPFKNKDKKREAQREWKKAKLERLKSDPEKYAAHLEKRRIENRSHRKTDSYRESYLSYEFTRGRKDSKNLNQMRRFYGEYLDAALLLKQIEKGNLKNGGKTKTN